MELPTIIFVALAAMLAFRLLAGWMDSTRIEAHIREMRGELIDTNWAPFGPGWFGNHQSRIYRIAYRDQDGQTHEAHVKTSMLSGVYLTNDVIVDAPPPQDPAPSRSLRAENDRLRRKIADLQDRSRS